MTLTARRLEDDRGVRVLLAIEDRTEAARLEAKQLELLALEQTARQHAEAADRIKDQFVALVSHELRSPLHSMAGWAAVLKQSPPDETTVRKAAAAVERGVHTQTRLIEDLLDYARMNSGRIKVSRQMMDLAEAAEAAVDTLRMAADAKNVSLDLSIEPGSRLVILGDPERMQQVAWNLLSNAVKFTPSGGRVEVWVGRVGTHMHLRVRDTGNGIRPEFLPEVFRRFEQDQQSGAARSGLGLGLAIVRELVELHGGTVEAASDGPGEGSTFIVRLPVPAVLVAASDGEEGLVRAAPVTSLLKGLHVLVVEDDPDGREMMTLTLASQGARVTAAASVVEALSLLHLELPDVIVSDIGMPEQNGYAFLRQLRSQPVQRGGKLPALALTAFAEPKDKAEALAAGFDRHLVKPVEPTVLAGAVARLAGR